MKKGFTLIEVLAVITILAILVAFSTVAVNNIRKKQELKETISTMVALFEAAREYSTDHRELLYNLSSNIITNSTIKTKDLYNQYYFQFDKNKYPQLLQYADGEDRTVSIRSCSSSSDLNNLKSEYIFFYAAKGVTKEEPDNNYKKSILFSDCGCSTQSQKYASTVLCEVKRDTGTSTCKKDSEGIIVCDGWDKEGKYYIYSKTALSDDCELVNNLYECPDTTKDLTNYDMLHNNKCFIDDGPVECNAQ